MRPNRSLFSTLGIAASLFAALALAAPLPALAQDAADPAEVVRRYVDQVLNEDRLDLLPALVAADRVDGFRKNLELRRAVFPDLRYRIEEMVSEGGRVVVRCTVTGHHVGDDPSKMPGGGVLPPSGNRLETEEALFYTVEDGRITRGEIVSDQLEVVKALGFTVVPPEGYEKGKKGEERR